jgi:hypothetical protein
MTEQAPECLLDTTPTQQQDATSAEVAPNGHNFTKTKRYKHSASHGARRSHKASAPQLLTRDRLDGRRNAVAIFDKHARAIQNDLGGADQLSAIQLDLIEAFVGEALVMQTMNSKILLGQEVDLGLHALVAGAMCRLATRLGVKRQARDVTPTSLAAYLATKEEVEA